MNEVAGVRGLPHWAYKEDKISKVREDEAIRKAAAWFQDILWN